MKKTYVALVSALTGAFLSSACSYSVSVNDNIVYTPEPLLTDYEIVDNNLRQCIEQTISDKKITAARQLTLLNCSNAGIATLAGLERFDALEELNLASNQLQSLAPLARLSQLKVVILRENKLNDIVPLLALLKLTQVDLTQNAQLNCADVNQLAANMREMHAEIYKPEQCR